ncbi:DMT family transporter [Lysinibacillus sphaericus]|uniref:DMT family transporter n=1 Tax=Lysinibacillus sphaericus TaxID=1421 RepID=UPI000C176E2A|nr:DMT family transporter [Lysinibacillus sphaericus]PIJ99404.1 EamA family transporter [Lysinibacillus sphaericus]QIC48480.1 DMT family transporter [Lysinibacillus sphaericus]QTB27694.1 DMT family transporter [Lysinibacillus sphaericus]
MSNKHYINGLWLGLFGGILWGVDTVLIGIILGQPILSTSLFLAPLVVTFLHDAFSSLWMSIHIILSGKLKLLRDTLRNTTSRFIVLAGIFGGPLGMTGYMMAIYYIGPSYTAIISATYPAIGAILSVFLLKEKLTIKMGIGLSMTIFATMLLGFNSSEPANNLIFGFFFAILCAIGWGTESVISAHGMSDNIVPAIALYLRQTTSAIVFAFIIIPLISGYELVKLIFNHSLVISIFLTALAGTISYLFYYTSIHRVGPIRAMGLNISYSAWAILISLCLGFSVSLREFGLACIIICGSLLTTNRPKEFLQLLDFKRKDI